MRVIESCDQVDGVCQARVSGQGTGAPPVLSNALVTHNQTRGQKEGERERTEGEDGGRERMEGGDGGRGWTEAEDGERGRRERMDGGRIATVDT